MQPLRPKRLSAPYQTLTGAKHPSELVVEGLQPSDQTHPVTSLPDEFGRIVIGIALWRGAHNPPRIEINHPQTLVVVGFHPYDHLSLDISINLVYDSNKYVFHGQSTFVL